MSYDEGTEAEALAEWYDDEDDELDESSRNSAEKITRTSSYSQPLDKLEKRELGKVKVEQHNNAQKNDGRWRCLQSGCNPPLTKLGAEKHKLESGHRVAPWPVRSVEGTRRAKARNRNGYYDKYNVGDKASRPRGH